jgi:hypothetical protein
MLIAMYVNSIIIITHKLLPFKYVNNKNTNYILDDNLILHRKINLELINYILL